MRPVQMALGACAAIPACAFADGVATWLWDVTTDNGNAIVEPGETATITLSMLMEPDVGDGPWVAFAAAIFDVLAEEDHGSILGWDYPTYLDEITGDLATTDGVSIFDISTGQLPCLGPFKSDNPVVVFTFDWAPNEYEPFTTTYTTLTGYDEFDHVMHAWEGNGACDSQAIEYTVVEANVAITVIPSPAAALVICAGALTRPRRWSSS